jgi:1-acyl-sn-glycerol-3-phosphate acyltransferase
MISPDSPSRGQRVVRRHLRLFDFTLRFALLTLLLVPVQMALLLLGRGASARLPVFYHRRLLRLLKVRVHTDPAHLRARASGPVLILSNHISWLDIVVLSSVMPVSFIAKSEVRDWPVFGFLARLQRTVFVDRQRRHKTGQSTREIAGRMQAGDCMVLFAEGTTSDGLRVLPFRSPLVGAAGEVLKSGVGERVRVQPVAIRYTHRDGLPLRRGDMPAIGWYGDMDLLPHLKDLVVGGTIDVQVLFGETLLFDAQTDRKLITKQAENEVRRLFRSGVTHRQNPRISVLSDAKTV